ncbi:hypothetical protein KEM60_02806 [Austwickia sp. TVS 96-490-7B]|uniref:hypothetical protein n=1 Tax=Austwickia sp. TVS 96-490-7B TaxID=2830843 RepID=UPI001C55A148|nr:hypothetical protein [Austwickia sp. TVS 96-490-7B]MBW3086578.1 hypothetical protein [Austwickia sp. TVS 96-490-7B]
MSEITGEHIAELVEAVKTLSARVETLENRLEQFHPTGKVPDDVLLAISAACAAYLGHRAKVKQVHLRRHTTWAKQGRSDVQHSHRITHAPRMFR